MPTSASKKKPTRPDAVKEVAESLHPLWHLDRLADNAMEITSAISMASNVAALSALAQFGDDDDKKHALQALRNIAFV